MNPILATIIANIIFGFSFYFTKVGLQETGGNYFRVVGWRFLAAAVFLTILIIVHVIKVDYKGKKILPLIKLCILSPIIYFTVEVMALNYTNSSQVGIMMGIVPVVVAFLMRIFYSEKLNKKQVVFMGISILGVGIINILNGEQMGVSLIGGVLLVICVLALSLFNIYIKEVAKNFTSIEITYFMMLVGATVFNTMDIVNHGLDSIYRSTQNIKLLGAVLFLGMVTSSCATLLMNYALTKISGTMVTILNNITTVVSIGCGVVLLGEALGGKEIVGSCLIIIGAVGVTLYNQVKKVTVT